LTLKVDKTVENSTVKKEETIITKTPNGGTLIRQRFPRKRWVYDFTLKGPDLCREIRQEAMGGELDRRHEVILIRDGWQLQYTPDSKQATFRKAPADLEADPIDPRCFGFAPGTASIPEWLGTLQVTEVRELSGREIELVGLERNGARVSAAFDAKASHLPVRVCYYYDDGSVRTAARLSHEPLQESGAWFIKDAEVRVYTQGQSRDPNALGWICRTTIAVKDALVDPVMPPDLFDPLLPTGVLVVDGVTTPLGKPTRSLRLQKDEHAAAILEASQSQAKESQQKWFLLLLSNGLFLAVVAMFWRRVSI
jgi:hypothetical protein